MVLRKDKIMELKTIILSGDAERLIEHFIKYSELHTDDMADIMNYDYDGFKQRLKALKKDFESK